MNPKNRVFIWVEGGLVQGVLADDPSLRVIVCDYDVQAGDEVRENAYGDPAALQGVPVDQTFDVKLPAWNYDALFDELCPVAKEDSK